MSGMHDRAVDAMHALLAELPAEFGENPDTVENTRSGFEVKKKTNVRKVHRALWDLQEYLGLTD